MHKTLTLVSFALVGCISQHKDPPALATSQPVCPPPITAPVADLSDASPPFIPTPDTPPVVVLQDLATAHGDLDGDGTEETLTFKSDGAIHIVHNGVELPDPARPISDFASVNGEWSHYAIEIVDIDKRDHQKEVMFTSAQGDEDPEGAFSFWKFHDNRLDPMLRHATNADINLVLPHGVRPAIPGNGTVSARYALCIRDANVPVHPGIERMVQLQYKLVSTYSQGDELDESISTSRRTSQCVLAACPFVYVGAESRLVGEVLRNVRTAADEQWQSITLPTSAIDPHGNLQFSLREEKHEITWIDSLYLEADGQRIQPLECASNSPSLCREDAQRTSLERGQTLSLRALVGHPTTLRLWVKGYYLPLDDGDPLSL